MTKKTKLAIPILSVLYVIWLQIICLLAVWAKDFLGYLLPWILGILIVGLTIAYFICVYYVYRVMSIEEEQLIRERLKKQQEQSQR